MATYVAREGFAFTSKDGLPRVVGAGELMDDSDPDYKGREHLFQPATERTAETANRRGRPSQAGRAVETASAAPGEQRTRTHPTPPKQQPSK